MAVGIRRSPKESTEEKVRLAQTVNAKGGQKDIQRGGAETITGRKKTLMDAGTAQKNQTGQKKTKKKQKRSGGGAFKPRRENQAG